MWSFLPLINFIACKLILLFVLIWLFNPTLYNVLSSHSSLIFFWFISHCMTVSYRTWRSEPAWGCFCKRQAPPGCSATANCRTRPSRGSALRHLTPATSQPWMRQQDTGQVISTQKNPSPLSESSRLCGDVWKCRPPGLTPLSTADVILNA